uniref:Uncharacterized protein n=1 Tax=Falco tinnunculus TaxID=100819 RepID=A0A8C4XMP8_FALTI
GASKGTALCAGWHGRVRTCCVQGCAHRGVSIARTGATNLSAPGDMGLQQSCVLGAGTGRIHLGPVAH